MYYRSDWPELGLNGPISDENIPIDPQAWQRAGNGRWRWVSKPDDFESKLYEIPICNLHLEILDTGEGGWLARGLHRASFSHRLQDMLQRFLERAPWSDAYVATKITPNDPLSQVLTAAGFEPVEHRCLYTCEVSKLRISRDRIDNSIDYRSLATIAASRRDGIREQILDICKEGFQRGHSRHFSDAFLRQRAPGLTYILDVMKRNFERVPLHFILLALDTDSGHLCGFSILQQRPGLGKLQYTQLLSGVRKAYRGRGVYGGLTHLLTKALPAEARLVNVTHAENHAMRRAYRNTGRLHYADTLVLRCVFSSAA